MSNSVFQQWHVTTGLTFWMNHDIVVLYLILGDLLQDTLYYVPCVGRYYSNLTAARKAIGMYNHRTK